jgi:hypothetical protein
MTKTPEEKIPVDPSPAARFWVHLRWFWRRLENLLFWLVFLLIVLYFVLQSSAVQNWLVGKVTTYLSEELETTVRISNVDIEFFDNVVLENFFVADRRGDTLLYAEKFTASLNSNIFALLSDKMEFNEISLAHARLNVRRREGEADNNAKFVLDYLSGTKKTPKKPQTPFRIRIQNLRLTDVAFTQEDAVTGRQLYAHIPKALVRADNIDFPSKVADIRSVALDGLILELRQYEGRPLPATRTAEPAAPVAEGGTADTSRRVFIFNIDAFSLTNGQFAMDRFSASPDRGPLHEVMNFNHLAVKNIEFQADSIFGNEDLAFGGRIRHLSAREQSGFELSHAGVDRVVATDTLLGLYGIQLQTPQTTLGDTIIMEYDTWRDFRRFNDEVHLDVRLKEGSRVHLRDLQFFSPALYSNGFFTSNRDEVAELSGQVRGRINDLRGRGLNLRVGQNAYARFDFRGDDLTKGTDRLRLEFDFEDLRTDFQSIRDILPGFTAPSYFDRLGRIGFIGNYQVIFGYNHIARGNILTNIGSGSLDMELDLTGGKARASYSGKLAMQNFDLGAWTGDPRLGKTTFNVDIAEGSTGLTLPTIDATLRGTIESLVFRGYNYRNVAMQGKFKEYVFTGDVKAEDPNLIFDFQGTINVKDTMPVFAFRANVERLDLGALNLSEKDWVVSGTVDDITLRARSWEDATGSVKVRNLRLTEGDEITHRVDSLHFASGFLPNGRRYVSIASDVAEGTIEGRFDFKTAPRNLFRMFTRYYPAFAERFGVAVHDSLAVTDSYVLDLFIRDTRSLTRLVAPGLDTLRDVRAVARVDGPAGVMDLRLDLPFLRYENLAFYNSGFNWRSVEDRAEYELLLPNVRVARQQLTRIRLSGFMESDRLQFNLRSQDTSQIVSDVRLLGDISIDRDSIWQIHFNTSEIALFNQRWFMDEDNYLRIGNGYFEAQNFDLMNGNQRILVDTFNQNKGISLSITNLDLELFNSFLPVKKFRVRGKIYDMDLQIRDLYRLEGIESYVTTDTLFINERPYGRITGNIEMANLKSPVWTRMFLEDGQNHQLRLLGAYGLPGSAERTYDELGAVKAGEIQLRASADNFPLYVLETFIPGISKTAGNFDLNANIGGPLRHFNTEGEVTIGNGQFQIDYLKSMYHLHNQKVILNNYQIWADGDTIFDASDEQMALIRGGLRHDHFKAWRLDCDIASVGDNFMILNTTRRDNSLYYGQALGRFRAAFSGTFARPNIRIDAVTGRETRLFIPLSTASETQEVSFIKFRPKAQDTLNRVETNSFIIEELKGLNFEMNLTVTDAAEVQLIFDEQAGDVVKGRGEGDINLSINREGEFKMYGNYIIRRGEYLFTLLNWVNKPFTVLEGGSIAWYGDPYSAQITLDATYEENTPLYNFLSDEIKVLGPDESSASNALYQEAQKPTRVVVTMHLTGDLMKPNITFDLEFPNLPSQLKTLAENKLRVLRQDQAQLNRQVFGLVVVGSFLPTISGSPFIQNRDYVASAFNTLTQVLSNQFSNYLTQLAAEWFGGAVSSIDLDIAYNDYRSGLDLNDPNTTQIGRDLQVRLTSGFAEDRITIQVGSQFGLGRPGTNVQDGFLGEDVTVEIQLTKNRQWRAKVYQRTEPDLAGGSRRFRFGGGISFRKDYSTFQDLVNDLTGLFREEQ